MSNIQQSIEKNKEKFTNELIRFCAQPSIAAEDRGMVEMANMVEEKLRSLGATVKKVSVEGSYPFIFGELKAKTNSENKKTVLIYNHYDAQPAGDIDLWETHPFDPEIRDGKLYARGVADNKGGVLHRLQGVELLLQQNDDLPVNLKWLIEGEEEIGSPHLHPLQEKYGDFWKNADVCLWESGGVDEKDRPMMSLGKKGVLYVELEVEYNERDLHSSYAAIVGSPVWRLVKALDTLKDDEGKVIIDDFYENALKPTPAEEQLMQNEDFDPSEYLRVAGAQKALASKGDKVQFLKQMYYTATCNICGILGGYTVPGGVKTVLPNKATAKIDFRLVPNQKVDEILEKLRTHLDKRGFSDVKVRKLISEEAGKSHVENDYIQKCLKVMQQTYNKEPSIRVTTLGSGPVYSIADVYNIPVVYIGVEYPGFKVHAPNENIRMQDYWLGMEAFINYLSSLAD